MTRPVIINDDLQLGSAADPARSPFLITHDDPGAMQTFGIMARDETITGNLIQFAREPEATRADIETSLRQGWNAQRQLDQRLLEDPVWKDNTDGHIKLLQQPTPELFEYWDGVLTQEYHNDQMLNRAGGFSVLGFGFLANAMDPISAGINIATGPFLASTRAARFLGQMNLARSPQAIKLRDAYKTAIDAGDFVKANSARRQFIDTLGGRTATQTLQDSIAPATIDASLAEYLAQETQPTRSFEESMINIGGSAAFSGLLGGASMVYNKFITRTADRFITERERAAAQKGIKTTADAEDSYSHPGTEKRYQETGSARPPTYDPDTGLTGDPERRLELLQEHGGDTPEFRNAWWKEQQEFTRMARAGKKGTGITGLKWVWRLHPSARFATAMNPEARIIGEQLLDSDYMYDAILRGDRGRIPSAEGAARLDVHTGMMDTYDVTHGNFTKILRKQFPGRPEFMQVPMLHPTLWRAYNQEVTSYIYDPDHVFSPQFRPFADEIADAANSIHSKVFKPWEQQKLDAGMIEDIAPPSGQRWYMNRMWNTDYARRNTLKLAAILREEYHKQLQFEDGLPEYRITTPNQNEMFELGPKRSEIMWGIGVDEDFDTWRARLGPGYESWAKQAQEFTTDMEDKIQDFLDRVGNSTIYLYGSDLLAKNPYLKHRIQIPTKRLLQVDPETGESFLLRDVMQLTESYLRQTAPDYHIRMRFGRRNPENGKWEPDDGELSLTNERLSSSYTQRIETLNQLRDKTDDATARKSYDQEIAALTKEEKRVLDDLKNSVQIMKGQYGHPENPDGVLAKANLLMRTINFQNYLGGMTLSAIPDFAYTVLKTGFGTAMRALASRFTRSVMAEMRRGGITREDVNILGVVTELHLHGKIKSMFHVEEGRDMSHWVDRWANYSSSAFSKVSLMTRWNHTMKEIAATAHLLKIHKAMNRMTKADRTYLLSLGLDEPRLQRVKNMWAAHGTTDAGIDAPNIQAWSDPFAKRIIRESLIRATDATIVTPTVGSLPHVMRTPMGKLFFQFQSFPVTVMDKVVLPSLQRFPDAKPEVMAGTAMALTLGALVSVLKDLAKDPTKEPDLRPGYLVRQAVDRSGILGPYMTGLRPVEDITGLDRVLPEGFADTHRSRDPITELMGAWYRTAGDYSRIMGGVFHGEWDSQGFASSVRRQTPWNNLFYLQWLTRAAQEAVTGEEIAR